MAAAAYEALTKNIPVTTCVIDTEEEDGEYDCYDIKQSPALLQLVITRLPTVFYVSILALDTENAEQVFNLTFFDEENNPIGGAELTSSQIYWDDDN
jgi:hypothetical protein